MSLKFRAYERIVREGLKEDVRNFGWVARKILEEEVCKI